MSKPWENGLLTVSENKRYLVNGDKPFFWVGDTAWLLFENMTLEESRVYLQNRRDKGFNLIQITLVHSRQKEPGQEIHPGNGLPRALFDGDFGRLNLDGGFWQNVDAVLDIAEELGLYIALLPAWGGMVKGGFLNMDNVESYGRFLAERYGARPNVIWLLGGDVRGDAGYDVYMKLGTLLKSICPDRLTGFHPFGRTTSSFWFNEAPWLDFNMFQSGHRRYDQIRLKAWDDNLKAEGAFGEDNWRYVRRDLALTTVHPTVDGEPSYEQIPQGLHDPNEPYWQDHDTRRYAWWSVLEGACGHTFGHNSIMQFFKPISPRGAFGVKTHWFDAIHDPGAGQMGHLATFMNDFDFINGLSADELIVGGQKEGYARVSAFAGGDFAAFYSYTGEAFAVDLSSKGWQKANAWWFDPAQGVFSFAGTFNAGELGFTPPKKPTEWNDWALLLKKA